MLLDVWPKLMKSPQRSWGIGVLLLAMVFLVDATTVWEVKFTAFYIAPVAWIAWTRSIREGMAMALLATIVWYLVDLVGGTPSGSELLRVWNGVNRLIAYGVIAWAIGVSRRALLAQQSTISRLEAAMAEVQELRGILPVCAWCRKIRSDDGQWQTMEAFLSANTRASASHGICPDCAEKMTGSGG